MITCRYAIMTMLATLGASGAAIAGEGPKGPYPGECLTCHAVADRGGQGPLIASAGGRSAEAATGFRFCDGPLTVGELSIGKMSDATPIRVRPIGATAFKERDDRLAFLRALIIR